MNMNTSQLFWRHYFLLMGMIALGGFFLLMSHTMAEELSGEALTLTPEEEVVTQDNLEGTAVVIEVAEDIRAGTVVFVQRALLLAEETKADMFVIELNTPGGLLKATQDISRILIDAKVPTVVYLHEETGWAFSAGALIALSADTVASTRTGVIGAAEPIDAGGESAGEKAISATEIWIQSLAERKGKDVEIAGSFVRENVTLSAVEAYEVGIIDILAESRDELFSELGYSEVRVIEERPNIYEIILSFISIPYLVPLLLSLGAVGLFFVFRTGEFDSIGIFGVVLLLLGLWGMGAVQLSAVGILLLLFGILMVVLALMLEGVDFGVSGIIGIIAIFFGVVTFASEPLFPTYFSQVLFWSAIASTAVFATFFIIVGRLSLSAQLLPVKAGMEAFIGVKVPVVTMLAPQGIVLVQGEQYPARLVVASDGPIAVGSMVEVVKTEGNTILVKRVAEDSVG